MAYDVIEGLRARPKRLSPKYFYDATGSALFEEITRLPEYYLTSTEYGILERNAREILSAAGGEVTVLELGAGSAAKTTILLRELQRMQSNVVFHPLDVSRSALDEAVEGMARELPGVVVVPQVLDYTETLQPIEAIPGRKLVLYIGSSIGNFEPFQASAVLRKLHNSLRPGDSVLLGTDMRKSESVLLPAYDDPRGITAAFNKNVLAHINRELDADFDLDNFSHQAIWNARESRIEMHLRSRRRQKVKIAATRTTFTFAAGETIHTENSYKFTMPMVECIAENSGFGLERTWTDSRNWFTVHLLRA